MLTDYFSARFTIARHRGTPFGSYLDGFTEWLAEQDYMRERVRLTVQTVTALGLWLPDAVAPHRLDEDVLDRYALHLRRIGRFKHASGRHFSFSTGPRLFLKYLRATNIAPPPRATLSPIVDEFRGWLRVHRGAAVVTVTAYASYVQSMVDVLGDPRNVTPTTIRAYLLRVSDGRGRSYVKSLCSAVRAFLRFLIATGRVRSGLDGAVPRIAKWRLAELPRFIERADVRRVVAAADPTTERGLRDRAVLTMIAEMGLRAGDIGAITLDAIDWTRRTLTVVGKGAVATRLPMPASVVSAVRAYIKRGRPDVDRSPLFLSLWAPYRAVSRQSVSHIVRIAVQRAGVVAPSSGPHMLRHSFAVEMLRRGLPLDAIGALLRHRSLDATAKYAKVDANRLGVLAVAWKEVAPC